MTVFEIDVMSDFLCMWCYIGKRNLDRAISLYLKTYPNARTSDTFILHYRPYYLNFSTEDESQPRAELAEKRLAHMSASRREAVTQHMNKLGRAAGIAFQYEGWVGRTQDAHRLVHAVSCAVGEKRNNDADGDEEENPRDRLVDGIMGAFHEDGLDIADRDVLRAIAKRVGVEDGVVEEAFTSDSIKQTVDEEANKSRERIAGAGVPTYFVNETQRVNGSQDPMDWMELFISIKEGKTASFTAHEQVEMAAC